MTSRIEKIEAMLVDDPADTFLQYSLAMEQEKSGLQEASEAGLRSLMKGDPPYVPAFFMLAQHLTKRSQIEDAQHVLRDGIEVARVQNNQHAAGEMSEFLATLGNS